MKNDRPTVNPVAAWKEIISGIRGRYELLRQLVVIGLTGQFKRTMLGNAWLILDPLLSIIIWLILARSGMFKPGVTEIPYPAYLLISFSLWMLFEGFFTQIGHSVSEAGRMLMEVPFPLEIKVAEKIVINLINFMLPITITLICLLVMGIPLKMEALLFLPSLLPLMLLGIAVGMFFSLLEVVLLDVFLLVKRCLRLLMYLTPVVYAPRTGNGILDTVSAMNPLTYLISMPRDLLTGTSTVHVNGYWIASGFSLLIFLAVVHFYFISKKKVIEKLLD